MDGQTLRDWVHRYDASGPDSLRDQARCCGPPRLSEASQARRMAAWMQGGVVRWRHVDLQQRVDEACALSCTSAPRASCRISCHAVGSRCDRCVRRSSPRNRFCPRLAAPPEGRWSRVDACNQPSTVQRLGDGTKKSDAVGSGLVPDRDGDDRFRHAGHSRDAPKPSSHNSHVIPFRYFQA